MPQLVTAQADNCEWPN